MESSTLDQIVKIRMQKRFFREENSSFFYVFFEGYMQWKFTLTTNAVYTGYTSYFATKLKAISVACPYKTIYNVDTYQTNNIPIISSSYRQLIIFRLTLYLTNTIEIGGFRIKIQNRDESYNNLTDDITFLNIQNGGSYPCTRNTGNVAATS